MPACILQLNTLQYNLALKPTMEILYKELKRSQCVIILGECNINE